MCGIIAVLGNNPKKHVKRLYEKQKSRGVEGFGFLAIKDSKLVGYERDTKEGGIFEKIQKLGNIDALFFHHRFPTSTPNYEDAAHPIKVSNDELEYDYFALHNGVISNHAEMYKKHTELGYEYETLIEKEIRTRNYVYKNTKYNDSECLAIELARYLDGKSTTIDAKGSMAFMVIKVDKKDNPGHVVDTFYGKDVGRPLRVNRFGGMKYLTISSENNKGFDVHQNVIYSLDLKSKYFSEYGKLDVNRYEDNWYKKTSETNPEYNSYIKKRAEKAIEQLAEINNKRSVEKQMSLVEFYKGHYWSDVFGCYVKINAHQPALLEEKKEEEEDEDVYTDDIYTGSSMFSEYTDDELMEMGSEITEELNIINSKIRNLSYSNHPQHDSELEELYVERQSCIDDLKVIDAEIRLRTQ